MIEKKHLDVLRKYFPPQALDTVAEWLPRYGIYLTITRERTSKHGDFSYVPRDGMYRISVNGSLSPYAFLLTFVHEVAHLVTFRRYGKSVTPHGREWKETFRTLMLSLPLTEIYPHDILVPLWDYLRNPFASSDRHEDLRRALDAYDMYGRPRTESMQDDMTVIEDLSCGDEFIFRERHYTLGTKRRTLYLCTRKDDGRMFLFRPHTQVKKEK